VLLKRPRLQLHPREGIRPDLARHGLPLTHVLRITRGVLLKGNGIAQIWPELWPIAAFAICSGVLAVYFYRETLD
jgi:ABC-type multidrug transport system permease subunit